MILTGADGKQYWAHFRHFPEPFRVDELRKRFEVSQFFMHDGIEFYISKKLMDKIRHKRSTEIVTYQVTQCGVHSDKCPKKTPTGPCDAVTLVGESITSPLDTFERLDGRKRALRRAIQSLPRQLRGQLWLSYGKQRMAATLGHEKEERFKGPGFTEPKKDHGGLRPLGR